VSDIDDILREIKRVAEVTPRGDWIRATGYSDFDLREKRHPTRRDLDLASPCHPVRLNHQSGHASVLNSLALERVGIGTDTEEPPGGTIARDIEDGKPNGLLLEMSDWLDGSIPPMNEGRLRDAVSQASRMFLSQGVTCVMDATPSNSVDRWKALRRVRKEKLFVPSLHLMPGADRIDDFLRAGLPFGKGDDSAMIGHAKIVITQSGGRLHPRNDELKSIVKYSHARGFPVAIHAVEADAVTAAAEALAANRAPVLRDRIEHASECPPSVLDALLRASPVVVSQPRFILDSGLRYLREFGADAQWLYRFKTFVGGGLTLAASSDAPVSAPSPIVGMCAAITRQVESGEVVGEEERLTAIHALEMHTKSAAYAVGAEDMAGTIAVGKRADIAILSADPTIIAPERLRDVSVTMTIVNGDVVWQA
jgi:predicted amidohydrolase YtcJ